MLAESDILQLLYDLIKQSDLYLFIKENKGELYKKQRPNGRIGKMDAVISILSGSYGKYQQFIANVNIYIPDINSAGEFIEDTALSKQVQKQSSFLFEHIDEKEYFITYSDSAVPLSYEVEETHEHFINNKLLITFQNF